MNLPRLLYLADVPVEPTVYGSALIYRLLQDYPPEKLVIMESNYSRSDPNRRLQNVRHITLPVGISRLYHSRLSRWYGSWFLVSARKRQRKMARLLNGFKPEAILTVTHGFSWLTAAAYAERQALPLHLILHDEWAKDLNVVECLRPGMDKTFGHYYRYAASRFCVSPYMAEQYRVRYGVEGQVLYPSRAADAPCFDKPPEQLLAPKTAPVFAYGGTVNFSGYPKVLRHVARVLGALGGRLIIFGPLDQTRARAIGLDLPNVELRGMVKSEEMIKKFREEADALILPMSFEACDRANMEISFPSKLTDYTAAGLPILIYGPAYCSAVRWARENPVVAEVIDKEDDAKLKSAVERMVQSSDHRMKLAAAALEIGSKKFSHGAVKRVFESAITTNL